MSFIDLHVHTTASDGTDTPGQLIDKALELGLGAVAVTDHDCLLSCSECMELGRAAGLEVVPGIEISTKFRSAVHILGYYLDIHHPELNRVIEWEIADRDNRNVKITSLLQEHGINISYEDMKARFGEVVGRPHFGQVLVEAGMAADISDAFARYLSKGRPFWIPRQYLSLQDSIQIIARSGGVPVVAHPFEYRLDDRGLRELLEECIGFGLKGMECRYSGYSAEQSGYLEALAEEYGLIKTGGSDYHGSRKPSIRLGSGTGDLQVPYEYLERLKLAAGK